MALYNKYFNIVSEAFNNCVDFKETYRTAFRDLIDQDVRVARYLAFYVDLLVKKEMQKKKQKTDSATSASSNNKQSFDEQISGIMLLLR